MFKQSIHTNERKCKLSIIIYAFVQFAIYIKRVKVFLSNHNKLLDSSNHSVDFTFNNVVYASPTDCIQQCYRVNKIVTANNWDQTMWRQKPINIKLQVTQPARFQMNGLYPLRKYMAELNKNDKITESNR